MATRHKNTALKMQRVYELAQQHYEEGNQSKCYKAVWRYHVYPVCPMCYITFLSYIHAVENATPLPPAAQPTQLSLF